MNAPEPLREQTVKACMDACAHSARLCTAAADARDALAPLLLRTAAHCESISSQIAAGRMPTAAAIAQAGEHCPRAAEVCEELDDLAECAAACRGCAQICLTLSQAGSSADRAQNDDDDRPAAAQGALTQRLRPDAALAEIVGSEPLTRADVTRRVWAYIKANELQDRHDRRRIHADERLLPVFDGKQRISMFEMSRCLNRHLN